MEPEDAPFIFAERSGIYIIDLQKTLRQIQKAQELLRSVVLKGESVLFVCTKKQLKAIVQAEAQSCGAFYVTERWLGGMLTNFQTLKKQIRRLRELEQGAADGDFENYTKKEKLLFERERVKLSRNLEGIKQMGRLPGRAVRRRRQEGEDRRRRGQQARHPGRRHRRHQRRSGRHHRAGPRQRRRDPLGLADHRRPGRRDQGSPRRRCRCARSAEDLEAETYSTDAGSEGDADADRKRRRPRRKRRPKPEAIAARLKTDADGARPSGRRRGAPGASRCDTARGHPERTKGPCPQSCRRFAALRAGRERRLYYSPLTCDPGWRLWRARRFPRRT